MPLKNEADEACRLGDFRLALDLYTKNFEQDGVRPAVLLNRSVALSGLQQWQDALADIQQALVLQPDWPKAYYRLGSVLLMLRRPVEAVDALQTALQLSPTSKAVKSLLKEAETAKRFFFRDRREGPKTLVGATRVAEQAEFPPSKANTSIRKTAANGPARSVPHPQDHQPAEPTCRQHARWHCVLGLSETASRQQIRSAYLEKVAQAHPDKGGSTARFHLLQQAYEALTGPQAVEGTQQRNPTAAASGRQYPPSSELTDAEYLTWQLDTAQEAYALSVTVKAQGNAQEAASLLTCAIRHLRGIAGPQAGPEKRELSEQTAQHMECGSGREATAASELLQRAFRARSEAFCELRCEQQALADAEESGHLNIPEDTCPE